jgi:hypothetical protein
MVLRFRSLISLREMYGDNILTLSRDERARETERVREVKVEGELGTLPLAGQKYFCSFPDNGRWPFWSKFV